MIGTRVTIEAEGCVLRCPNCDALFEEIHIHRAYETAVECFECLETSTLVITLER